MAEQGTCILKRILNEDEIVKIPGEIFKKVEAFIEKNFEEFITTKAIYQAERDSTNEKIAVLNSELEEVTKKHEADAIRLKNSLENSEELQNEVVKLRAQLKVLDARIVDHDKEIQNLKQQRDSAVDERNELLTSLERRNAELGILKTDLTSMTKQLQDAVNAKCEVLLKVDEIQSKELEMKFKEQELNSVRPMLEEQIKSLMEDLNKSWAEVANIKRDQSSNSIILESKLASKVDELRICQGKIKSLNETNASLETRVEELVQKVKELGEESHKMRESYRDEIASKTRLADLYKECSEEQKNKNKQFIERLESTVKELEEASEKSAELGLFEVIFGDIFE